MVILYLWLGGVNVASVVGELLVIWLVALAKCLLLYLASEKPLIKSAEFSWRSYCGGAVLLFTALFGDLKQMCDVPLFRRAHSCLQKKKKMTEMKQKRALNVTSPRPQTICKPFREHTQTGCDGRLVLSQIQCHVFCEAL